MLNDYTLSNHLILIVQLNDQAVNEKIFFIKDKQLKSVSKTRLNDPNNQNKLIINSLKSLLI